MTCVACTTVGAVLIGGKGRNTDVLIVFFSIHYVITVNDVNTGWMDCSPPQDKRPDYSLSYSHTHRHTTTDTCIYCTNFTISHTLPLLKHTFHRGIHTQDRLVASHQFTPSLGLLYVSPHTPMTSGQYR